MKVLFMSILTSFIIISAPVYASWTEHVKVRYIDLDGDFKKEVIIESKHGSGTGHYIEDMRIFKDKYPELELIFTVRTLDSYFGYFPSNFTPHDVVSEVEFTKPNTENGTRDIIVKSKKIYYKDTDNKIIDKEENLGTKIFKWNGEIFKLAE